MLRFFALLIAMFFASTAFADTKVVLSTKPFNAQSAVTDADSSAMESHRAHSVSFQCVWASLGGTQDGTVCVETSGNGVNFDSKTDAAGDPVCMDVDSADGSATININYAVSEDFYRLAFLHGQIATTGTLTCTATFKG